MVHAYNSTRNDATGYSPYLLIFGREARLPVDICFGISPDGMNEITHFQYVTNLKENLKQAYQLARREADKVHQRNKRLHDKRVSNQALDRGDRVLIKNLGLKGKHKLETRWSSVPCVICEKLPNLPVYRVKPETGQVRIKTLHRDKLLPIGQLVRWPQDRAETDLVKGKKRQKEERESNVDAPVIANVEAISSETSSEFGYNAPRPYRSYLEGILNENYASQSMSRSVNQERDMFREDTDSEEGNLLPEKVSESDGSSSANSSVVNAESQQSSSDEEEESSESSESEPVREKRKVKPLVKLTYDEPGRSRDQPLTIVHRGVIIQIGQKASHKKRKTLA